MKIARGRQRVAAEALRAQGGTPLRRTTRGRPATLTRQQVVAAGLEILEASSLEDFTLARLAKRLGVATMTLYTYFPGREALLDAVAERALELMELPAPQGSWQQTIEAWLWALKRHFERFPVAMKLLAWKGHVPGPSLRVWVPIARLLRERGLGDTHVALLTASLMDAAIGFIYARMTSDTLRSTLSLPDLAELGPADRQLVGALWPQFAAADSEALFAVGFRALADGVERAVGEAAVTGLPPVPKDAR